jgi:hypothetical protein
LRSFEGGINIDSLYFATVRRATLIPSLINNEEILLSLIGFFGFSFSISFFYHGTDGSGRAFTAIGSADMT